jgi:hypothetical protein
MKNRFFFICLVVTSFCFAQTAIKGTVYNASGPMKNCQFFAYRLCSPLLICNKTIITFHQLFTKTNTDY